MQSGGFLRAFPGISFTANGREWLSAGSTCSFQSCAFCRAERGHVNQHYTNKGSLISSNQSCSKGQVTGHGRVGYHIPLLGGLGFQP